MTRSKGWILTAFCLTAAALISGCMSGQVRRGLAEAHRSNADWVKAADLLEDGLYEEGQRSWYSWRRWWRKRRMYRNANILNPIARRKAAEQITDGAFSQYFRGHMEEAEEDCEKALKYHSECRIADQLRSRIWGEKKEARAAIAAASKQNEAKEWDEALCTLRPFLHMIPTYATVRTLFEAAIEGSYQAHLKSAQERFQGARYADAVKETVEAMSRRPNDVTARNWYGKCLAHRRADEECVRAAGRMSASDFEGAYSFYREALVWEASFKPALDGRADARDKWVAAMLDEARTAFDQGGKSHCNRADDLLAKCLELLPEHAAAKALHKNVKRSLSQILLAEAEELLADPTGSRAATAWVVAERARAYDENLDGVAEMCDRAEVLVRAKATRFVSLLAGGDDAFGRDLRDALLARLPEHDVPCFAFSNARDHEQYKASGTAVAAAGCGQMPLRHGALTLIVSKHEADAACRERKKVKARAVTDYRLVPNGEWERQSEIFGDLTAGLGEQQAAHKQDRANFEAAKIDEFNAETAYNTASTRAGLLAQLLRDHRNRSVMYGNINLPNGMTAEKNAAAGLEAPARNAAAAEERTGEIHANAKSHRHDCQTRLSRTTSALRRTEETLCNARRYMDAHDRQLSEPVQEAYTFEEETWTCAGNLRIAWEGALPDGTVPDPMDIRERRVTAWNEDAFPLVAGSVKAEAVSGVRLEDPAHSNSPNPLPRGEDFLADLERKAAAACLSRLAQRFVIMHHHYMREADEIVERRGPAADAAERYALFCYTDRGRAPRLYNRAETYVNAYVREPLSTATPAADTETEPIENEP